MRNLIKLFNYLITKRPLTQEMKALYNLNMNYLIVGLGNPGDDYKDTRHNVGRMAVEKLAAKPPVGAVISDWKFDLKLKSERATGKIGKHKVTLVLPETFMNNSGQAVGKLVSGVKQAETLVVVHDDIDLPIGEIKLSFNRGSGGHKGIESVIKHVKTKAFIRLRIGICPTTPSGKLKKPDMDKQVNFVIGPFKPAEAEVMKKTLKRAVEAITTIVEEGRMIAMNRFN
jgi:peptidyl-tRNA hydrolase, PTH1 family